MTQPWNAARAVAHRRPHRRSAFAPVGIQPTYDTLSRNGMEELDQACRACGHHLCSCSTRRSDIRLNTPSVAVNAVVNTFESDVALLRSLGRLPGFNAGNVDGRIYFSHDGGGTWRRVG